MEGGCPLTGTVEVSGAKNATLPAIVASLLTDHTMVIRRTPRLADVETAMALVESLGKKVALSGDTLTVSEGPGLLSCAPEEIVRRMRASFLALGPLLARLGEARVPLPGGCSIGARPVDLHLKGLTALGADVDIRGGTVYARARRLQGTTVQLGFPSVGATEQLLLSGALAEGETVIMNPAREPEVQDLGRLLTAMGAAVRWDADRVSVTGRCPLEGTTHTVIPDRIETGTYLIAGAITPGRLRVVRTEPSLQAALLSALTEAGAVVETGDDWVEVSTPGMLRPVDIKTGPYPGFPTDLQPPWVALMTTAGGKSVTTETVFESRFNHVPELSRMGARLRVDGQIIVAEGPARLRGASVRASDIRAGAALLVAALAAQSRTELAGEELLRRGYDNFVGKLARMGAHIWESEANSDG
ncbi:MAG: UDP-N-acetylglucosamine 1-carboxyvinyltransferase [Candidatus Bipolaricaulota bacterium]